MGCAPCAIPCGGSMANCMTLVKMVMAPTAISPPCFRSEDLKQTEITLSLACMIKVAMPSATQGKTIFGVGTKFIGRSRRMLFFPNRKVRTHAQESACERMVASAAPLTPIPKA